MAAEGTSLRSESLRPLFKRDIDRTIETLVAELATPGNGGNESESNRPKWIRPATLVRRMKRFMVYN